MAKSQSNQERDTVVQSSPDSDTESESETNTTPEEQAETETGPTRNAAPSSDGDTMPTDPDGNADSERGDEERHTTALPQETREEVLADAGYRCQTCGLYGPEAGGLATLQVHHIEREPVELSEHDPANLTVLCRKCHNWYHHKSTREDAPVELSDADVSVLLPQDIEILRVLADDGPARTGDIAAAVSTELTVSTVRERLWVLMGVDNCVEERETQLVDKDVETNEWGLANQIETSARGHIPDDPQVLLQRMEDEQVRQALDRGCDRRTVAEVLGVSRRTTFNKEKRARAYGFPLDVYYNRGGRPTGTPEDTDPDTNTDTTPDRESAAKPNGDADSPAAGGDAQQRLDAVGQKARNAAAETTSSAADADQDIDKGTDTDIKKEVRVAIDALESVAKTL